MVYYSKATKAYLAALAVQANDHHSQATQAWRGAIMHARRAGDALIEAWEINGKRGRWGRWVRANFKGSRRTAREYMRIAKQWNHPYMVKARVDGIELNSIQTVLRVLRGEKLKVKQPNQVNATEDEIIRTQLRRTFALRMNQLTAFERRALSEQFDSPIWEGIREELRNTVRAVYESEVYGPELDEAEQELKATVRRRVQKLLNERKARTQRPPLRRTRIVGNVMQWMSSDGKTVEFEGIFPVDVIRGSLPELEQRRAELERAEQEWRAEFYRN